MNNQFAGGGRRWHGAQRPYQVLELFDVAEELGEGRSFLEQFAVNAEEQRVADEVLEADLAQVCGMSTSNGPCQTLPIYRPGGRAGGPCWRHLTPGQRELLEAVWDSAVAEHDCPGCVARAGCKCYAGNAAQGDKLRVVDGRWPRTRQFSGRSIHGVAGSSPAGPTSTFAPDPAVGADRRRTRHAVCPVAFRQRQDRAGSAPLRKFGCGPRSAQPSSTSCLVAVATASISATRSALPLSA